MSRVNNVFLSFNKDMVRHELFIKLEKKIKNPAGGSSRLKSETLLSAYVSLSCGRFEYYLQEVFFQAAEELKHRIKYSNDPRIVKADAFYWNNILVL